MITSILAFTIRIALVAVMTFLFVVLFEHGPNDFLEGASAEWHLLIGGKAEQRQPAGQNLISPQGFKMRE